MLMGQLVNRYSEPHRHYHNLAHIEFGYQQHNQRVGDMDGETFFAWTYHDAIYVPTAKDNEVQSARLFLRDNELIGFDPEAAGRINNLILSTQHIGEKNLLTDIDLSGLGLPPEQYDANTAKIRIEYSFVSAEDWKAGRTAFIERFLAQPRIYATAHFNGLEEPARENMKRELNRLS